ncbi:MAG TPA: hypothetical protein VLC46_16450 [Thermoanaerobaculia bacterium]|jgi:hypothetical protein|nr:hypothetical protein [Thermoanaerobaculia bacterium]
MSLEQFEHDDILSGYKAAGTINDRRGVLRVTDGSTVKQCDVAGAKVFAVLVNGGVDTTFAPALLEEASPVLWEAGGTYDDLDKLAVDNVGRVVTAVPGQWVVAIAEEASAIGKKKRVFFLGAGQYIFGDTIVDSTTGVADVSDPITLAAVANPNLAAWDGTHDPTAAEATAINAAITSLKNSIATLAAQINASH